MCGRFTLNGIAEKKSIHVEGTVNEKFLTLLENPTVIQKTSVSGEEQVVDKEENEVKQARNC